MSSLLSAELAATCNALGSLDKRTGNYLIDGFTLDTVKDLIRYLRRDDEDHEIRQHLGQTKVLETDLLPILINHSEEAELFDVTLRLVVNLTNPPLLLYREEIPKEKGGRRVYLQLLAHLSSYKAGSFTNTDVWTVLTKRLTKILEIDSGERDEDSGLIIERILILVRNILHVPADDHDAWRPDNDASVHDQVLWALNQSGLLDVILYMSSENEKPYFMHILEIISLALREQNPTSLADAALQRSVDEKLKDEQELLAIRYNEVKKKNEKNKNFSANRHSRFGGTFVVQNMKSISDNSLICHKPLNSVRNFDFSVNKTRVKKPKNQMPAGDVSTGERRSAFAIRLFLKEFCIEFLNASYNTMMYYVKDVLVRSKAQKNDETYYMWAMKFFMEFNRNYNFQVKLVSETMSVSTFHYVQQQMEKNYDMFKMEKGKVPEWVRRLHLSLKAYHELLLTMTAMDQSPDKSVQESSIVLKSNIFYVVEYREFILQMFVSFEDTKMSRSYLKDLIETIHTFLRMLEHFCNKHGLVVQKKVRSKAIKKGKKKPAAQKPAKPKPMSEEAKNLEWEKLQSMVAELLTGDSEISTDFLPFDATLEKGIDEQKGDCTKKIQKLLLENRLVDAVGLLRAGREVWPENDIFGSEGMPAEEEMEVLKMMFLANIGAEQIDIPREQSEEESNNEDDEDDDEEEEDGPSAHIVEADFKFDDFVNRLVHPKVIKACATMLQTFDKNSMHTNHCTIKLLHRVAWDCKTPSMLFQASLFTTFQKILSSPLDQYKELRKFAIFIVRKFTEVAHTNPKVFMELLFWKNQRDAYVIEHGYDDNNENKPGNVKWSEEQEEELRKLYNENQNNPSIEMDVIDWIVENLIERTRTRRGVISKLKELGLIFRAPTKKSNKASAKQAVPKEFTEEEDEKLRELWPEFRQASDPMGTIMARMPLKRPKFRFVDRLLELGLVRDKSECKKNKGNKSQGRQQDNSDRSDNSDSSDDGNSSSRPSKTHNRQKTNKKDKNKPKTVSIAAISRTLISCVDAGFTEGLQWVCESLEEVSLDQEAEGYNPDGESVPLVPIMLPCVEAMQNTLFQETLKCIGVDAPGDEQETYWRIPSHLHVDALRKRCEIITKAVEKTLIVPEEEENTQDVRSSQASSNGKPANGKDSSSSEEEADDFFNRLRTMGHNSSLEASTSKSLSSQQKNDKRKRAQHNSDEGEGSQNNEIRSVIKKKRNIFNSSSDSDHKSCKTKSPVSNKSDSDGSNNTTLKNTNNNKNKNSSDSDSDIDEETPVSKSQHNKYKGKKGKRLIKNTDDLPMRKKNPNDSSSSDEEVDNFFDQLRTMGDNQSNNDNNKLSNSKSQIDKVVAIAKKKNIVESSNSDSDSVVSTNSSQKTISKKNHILSDSEDVVKSSNPVSQTTKSAKTNSQTSLAVSEVSNNTPKKVKSKKNKKRVLSDSEEEIVKSSESDTDSSHNSAKHSSQSSNPASQTSKSAKTNSQASNAVSDVSNNSPKKAKSKKNRKRVLSDSEEEISKISSNSENDTDSSRNSAKHSSLSSISASNKSPVKATSKKNKKIVMSDSENENKTSDNDTEDTLKSAKSMKPYSQIAKSAKRNSKASIAVPKVSKNSKKTKSKKNQVLSDSEEEVEEQASNAVVKVSNKTSVKVKSKKNKKRVLSDSEDVDKPDNDRDTEHKTTITEFSNSASRSPKSAKSSSQGLNPVSKNSSKKTKKPVLSDLDEEMNISDDSKTNAFKGENDKRKRLADSDEDMDPHSPKVAPIVKKKKNIFEDSDSDNRSESSMSQSLNNFTKKNKNKNKTRLLSFSDDEDVFTKGK